MANFVDEQALGFVRRTAATEDGVLAAIKGACRKQDLPSITPEAGKFLQVLLAAKGAARVLEVGTCLGYSGVWMARALPSEGLLETIERDDDRADEAEEWFETAGVDDRVEVLRGKAMGVLPTLPTKRYDVVFIDADKENMPTYLDFGVRLLQHNGVLLADNIFWQGSVWSDGALQGTEEVREFVHEACDHRALDASILPLGDGLLVARRD